MAAPGSRTQARGLLLLLLVLGQEAQVVSAKVADASKNDTLGGGGGGGGGAGAGELKAFEQPDIAVTAVAEQGGAPLRSLLAPVDGWEWPQDTRLMFSTYHSSAYGDVQPEANDVVTVFPSIKYNMVKITTPPATDLSGDHDNAVIKLVSQDATRDDCYRSAFNMPVGTDFPPAFDAAQMGTVNGPLGLSVTDQNVLEAQDVKVFFMWGGRYKLCYTPDGTFDITTKWRENVVSVDIKVLGVRSPCEGNVADGCMRHERWECAFAYKGEPSANCSFDFTSASGRSGWSVETGDINKITWSQIYDADDQFGGVLSTENLGKYCAVQSPTIADTFEVNTDLATTAYLEADSTVAATMPAVVASRTEPFTVAACYCPSYDAETGQPCDSGDPSRCCHDFNEFIQQVGVLYYWTIKICDYDDYDQCFTPYMRVLPQQLFVTRVECPPGGGCLATQDNRIMYIDVSPDNDRPTWDLSHGCKTTTSEPASVVWPTMSSSRSLSGGQRIDWKVWRTHQVRINKSLRQALDLCFCNEDCHVATNWFKVGQVRTSNNFAYASRSDPSRPTDASNVLQTLKYVDHPGSFTLYSGILSDAASTTADPFDGNKYSGKALINIISYDRQTWLEGHPLERYYNLDRATPDNFQQIMDTECQRERYSTTLVDGPSHQQDAKAYRAELDGSTISQYHSFLGQDPNQPAKMFVKSAGVVAICYCAMVSDVNECENPGYWIFTGRLTIHGPRGGQEWIFPTNIVIKLSVLGWGLSASDRLRVIPAASPNCTLNTALSENNNDPMGDQHFKVGCPAQDGNGCTTAGLSEDIMVNILTGEPANNGGSGITITEVQPSLDHTVLTFSAPIDSLLQEDDIITINPSRIMVGGNVLEAMSPSEKFESYKFSGEYQFQDDITKTYQVGHRVSPVTVNGIVDPYKLSIPVGWPADGPVFTFVDDQGWWTRRNTVETNHELKGKSAEANLKLCWGVSDGTTTAYYAEAGKVSFEDPPPMRSARINLTTKQREAFAPIVVSFETAGERSEYAGATGKTMLVLRFLDTHGASSKLIPIKAGDLTPTGGTPGGFGDNDEVLPGDSRQWLCAKLFNEMWSSHEEGFPLPHGCYYGRKYRDAEEAHHGEPDPKFFRDIVIVFSERNGLRQGVSYQLAMNAQANIISAPDEELVDLYAMCYDEVGCQRPFMVFEKGQATSSIATELVAGASDPFWGTNGFFLQRGDPVTQVLSLSQDNVLQARITGLDGVRSIKASAMIRVYLWPLTQWSVGNSDCVAECISYHANNKQCTGSLPCRPEEVVAGSNRKNVIRLTLPNDMDEITGTTTHTVKVTGLTLPVTGFFPTRMGAQLTKPDDSAPVFIMSAGMLWKDPDMGQTTGRLVLTDRTGYGPRPFAGETDPNTLYVRLQVGATIWNLGEEVAASITITLPNGYTCSVPNPEQDGGPGGVPPMDLPVFLKDVPIDGYADNNRGVLSAHAEDGNWYNSAENVCEYTFAPFSAMFANQVAYVKLTVINPSDAMSKHEPQNRWKLKISSKGASTLSLTTYDMTEVYFITTAEEVRLNDDGAYWASNTAVISRLLEETIQPADFSRSCCGAIDQARRVTHQYLRIFFRTDKSVGQGGYVIIDAPGGFDFTPSCDARDLDGRYYAFAGEGNGQLRRLTNMGNCVGSRYPLTSSTHNRAKLQVQGNIGQGFYYGFEMHVIHPTTYTTAQHEGWYIWTQDSNGYGIEGSYRTVKFNPLQAAAPTEFYRKSWGMYGAERPDVQLYFGSTRPMSVSQAQHGEKVTFYPIEFPENTTTSLRITAPVGFRWADPAASGFVPRSNFSTEDFPMPAKETGVDNSLVWTSVTFRGATKYGFAAYIAIPDHNPLHSSNSFFVEFGYHEPQIEDRLMASVLPAPDILSLINCEVHYASNLVNYADNRMEFRIQTVSRLVENDGIVIKGDQNTLGFEFEADCNPVMLPGSPPMNGVSCSFVQATDSTPQITLKVLTARTLEPDFYRFELRVANPTMRILDAGTWSFGSYAVVDTYPNDNVIDAELIAPGFVVNDAMTDARLVEIDEQQRIETGRNDRPGQPNQLIFRFKLGSTPQTPLQLTLQGPRGFVFDQDCMRGLKTSANEVFGDNTEGSWPPDYEKWPSTVGVYGCEGSDNVARISIAEGLLRRNFYAFRIAVRANPMITPDWNFWSINYNGETSAPFPGFTVWTFVDLARPQPVSFAKSPGGATLEERTVNPVTIMFSPYKTIPAAEPPEEKGGLLRLTTPRGYKLAYYVDPQEPGTKKCTVDLHETGDWSTLFVHGIDYYSCEVTQSEADQTPAKLNLVLNRNRAIHGMADGPEFAKNYTLVVRTYTPDFIAAAGSPNIWELDSFADFNGDLMSALDVSQVEGFQINDVLQVFTAENVQQVFDGSVPVDEVDIVLRFPDPLKDYDRVTVTGPVGFNLVSDPETNTCNNFRYPDNYNNPLPTTGPPECMCVALQGGDFECDVRWVVTEGVDPALPQSQDIRFKIATFNPTRTPLLTQNFWRASHTRGALVKSSHVARSWDINPQLNPVDVQIVGPNMAAETFSDLLFTFTPVSSAHIIRIEALEPPEFDFGAAEVSPAFNAFLREGSTIAIQLGTAGMVAREPYELRINNVQLGRGGGQTRWNLYTFSDSEMQNRLDERLDFAGGFRLPGKITILGHPELQSQYVDNRDTFPVKSLFAPRVNEDATAIFRFMLTQPVNAQHLLVITCQGGESAYTLRTAPFVLTGVGQIDVSTVLDESGALHVTLLPGRPASEIALHPDTPYKISMLVYSRPGLDTWRFDTVDSTSEVTNTNDGMTQGFSPVERLLLTVQTQRAPPKAIIDVALNIEIPTGAAMHRLLVIAPLGFTFDDRAAGCGDMCTPGNALEGRRTAILAPAMGGAITKLTNVRIRVMTPEVTPTGMGPESITWFVEGRDENVDSVYGWGEGSGFMVAQMRYTTVSYAGVASLRATQIAFTFGVDVDAGSTIEVEPPPGYLLTCSREGSLRQISLPGGLPNCIDDPLKLRLRQTLTQNTYAFAIDVDLPEQTPTVNTFNIIVRDGDNNIVDAAYGLQGQELLPLEMGVPTLGWSRADPGQPTSVTVSLTFNTPTAGIKAILITLPELFQHNVEIPIDVQSLNKRFPVASGLEWAETSEPGRIKIFLDDRSEVIIPGPETYRFQFPVLMPPDVPRNNVWFASLCNDRSCELPIDRYVLVSFPMAGFNLREQSPVSVRVVAGLAKRRAGLDLGACILLPLFALFLLA